MNFFHVYDRNGSILTDKIACQEEFGQHFIAPQFPPLVASEASGSAARKAQDAQTSPSLRHDATVKASC